MTPSSSVQNVGEAVTLKKTLSLTASVATSTKDDDGFLIFELMNPRDYLIQWDIHCSGSASGSKFTGSTYIYQKGTAVNGLYKGFIVRF